MQWLWRCLKIFALLTLGLIVLWWGLMWAGQWPQPYSREARAASWTLGWQDRAYNLGVVVPGKIYRSAQPDRRLIEYLHAQYGIGRIITLNGTRPNRYHERARELGMEVYRFEWSSSRLPPREELDTVLGLIHNSPHPVLVHCTAGKDRTGYAIASYRIFQQGWGLERATAEMDSYWHSATRKPWFQDELKGRTARE